MDTLKQTVERIKILPRSERTLNLLYSTLAYISTIVAATLENKRPSTDQGDGPSSPIVAAEVDAANETIGDAIAESLSLVKASTATIAGAVVAWEESFSDVEDQKRKAKAKEKNRKERFQSLATDVVKALGNVSSVDFEMSELNDKNLNSATGGGNLIALRQQVLDLRQMNEKAVADVQKYHKEVESLKAALQRAQRGIANPEAVAQTYEQRGTVDISKPLAETDGDDPVPPPISTQLYDEVQRLQALVKTLRKVKETEADTATRAERIQNEDLQRIEGLLRKIQSGGLPEEDSGDSSTASGAPVPPPPPSDNSSGAPPPPPGPPPPPSGGSIPVPRAPLPKLNMPKAVKPMKPLQWNKVKENLVPNSIWKELAVETYNESDGDPSSLGLNVKMISEMFGKDETKIKAATVSPVPAKKIKKSLLEPKRAKAIAIMLAVLKQQIGLDTLRDEILGAELTLINEEQLRMLQMNAPTKFEVEQVLNFEGEISELGEAEQFIYAVADLKRLPQRLTSMMFKMRFIPEIEEITTDLDNVLNACKEVRDSRRLRRVLQKVLVVGNYLNGSSFRGNAFGFQMDALLKLKEVKTNGQDKLNPTLLHFIVRQIQFDDPDALIFWRDMPHVETASSVMFGKVSGSVEALRQGWRQIIKEKEALEPFEHLRNPKDRFLEVVKVGCSSVTYPLSYWISKEFVQTSESRLKATEEKLVLAEKSINDLLMFYGETTDDKTPQQFFSIITSFSKAFDKAKEDNRLADSRWYHEVVKAKTRRAAKGLSLIGDSRASAPNIAVTPSGPDGGGLTVPVDPTTMGVSALRFFDPKAMLKPVPGSEAFSRRLTVRGFAGPGRVVDGQLGVAMQMMRNGTLRLRRSMLFTDTPSIFEGQHVGSSDSGTGIGSAGQADPGGVKDTDAPAATGEAVSAVLDSYTYSASETETDA
ncbi:hypothetical protein BJ742DRAFT_76087 [Cladochytrium replicatum]|nr:hypothetical protein BJ742DRAFT_76087 [Cladochytrium replicatum]